MKGDVDAQASKRSFSGFSSSFFFSFLLLSTALSFFGGLVGGGNCMQDIRDVSVRVVCYFGMESLFCPTFQKWEVVPKQESVVCWGEKTQARGRERKTNTHPPTCLLVCLCSLGCFLACFLACLEGETKTWTAVMKRLGTKRPRPRRHFVE